LHDLDLKEESTQKVLPEDIPLLSRIQSRCVDVVNNNDIPEGKFQDQADNVNE
jgi:hypothetical protein